MRYLLISVIALAWPCLARAQYTLSGQVKSAADQKSLPAATIVLSNEQNKMYSTLSDEQGFFQLRNLPAGLYELKASYLGFRHFKSSIRLDADLNNYNILLEAVSMLSDEVIVKSTRAAKKTGSTYSEIGREQIREQNLGQDFPYLLQLSPSTVVHSDAGAGIGYSGIRIRGVDPTRINVTVNGIPINDAESQGMFWVNMPDFASSVDNVQIQRGVGTSTNGAAAFGASINVQSSALQQDPYAEVSSSYGSFNTHKYTARMGSGLLKNGWVADARLSLINSDGFIDRARSDLKSYYLGATRYGKKSLLKLVHFSGKEITYQAWNGIPQSILDTNRTFNEFTYQNQVDHYQQDHYQVLYSLQLRKKWLLNTAFHYTKGRGYFEEYKSAQKLSAYGLQDVITGNDTIRETDLVRRRWLDNDFTGFTFSLQYEANTKTSLNLGGAANYYFGRHFGEVVWATFASNSMNNYRYYENTAAKYDAHLYLKANYQLLKKLSSFLDLQYRHIDYSFLGYDRNLNNVKQSVQFGFFNPKLGLVYEFNDSSNVYASFSIGNREPNRDDFTNSSPDSRPKSEQLKNLELGWRKTWKKANVQLTYYLMHYKDQLILTGKINDVGAYTRINVPVSYRSGVEISASINISRHWQWAGSYAYSMNKVKAFTEYIDDYDWGGQWTVSHKNTDITLSPSSVASSMLRYSPIKKLHIDFMSKYVSRQYLDNTQEKLRSLDPYLVNDLRISFETNLKKVFSSLRIAALCNNLLDEKYEPNGYTYSGFSGGQRQDYNFYFPQAGRNYLLQLTLGF